MAKQQTATKPAKKPPTKPRSAPAATGRKQKPGAAPSVAEILKPR